METNELSVNAMGGTELMMHRIHSTLDPKLLEQAQIIPSRVRDLDTTKIRILYCHDLADDPEAEKALGKGGWQRFHKIVFVSNWQMQTYIARFDLPWSKCIVLPNAIEPIKTTEILNRSPDDKIKFIYHTTPHRGLNILVAVFDELRKKFPNIHLDVYSSFKIYGWPDRDKPFEDLFEKIKANEGMTYHGSVSNEEVRQALTSADVFAYPCVWPETSCLSLIEAMSAGLVCVHPNFGGLYETASNWTTMYQFNEDINGHASWLFQVLEGVLQNWGSDIQMTQVANQKQYVDVFHNWNYRKPQWEAMISSLLNEPRELPEDRFIYNVGT